MPALAETDMGGEKAQLVLVEDETLDISPEMVRQHRYALGAMAIGEFRRAEEHFRLALLNLNRNLPKHIDILLDQANMREQKGETWLERSVVAEVIELLLSDDTSFLGSDKILEASQRRLTRIDVKLEQLSKEWVMPSYSNYDTKSVGVPEAWPEPASGYYGLDSQIPLPSAEETGLRPRSQVAGI